ncbi:hypothetical protein BpHYR1_046262 [Brachionus plicatilis]|uniref:Uncharacterized protein n=1 Tax=Brachionus plicatilis TaxID=10195 RepID=A0A3M7S536_BRAPC|nr:hypothetical protein BpHYR1_046262 [Brachionus plicatilis]
MKPYVKKKSCDYTGQIQNKRIYIEIKIKYPIKQNLEKIEKTVPYLNNKFLLKFSKDFNLFKSLNGKIFFDFEIFFSSLKIKNLKRLKFVLKSNDSLFAHSLKEFTNGSISSLRKRLNSVTK